MVASTFKVWSYHNKVLIVPAAALFDTGLNIGAVNSLCYFRVIG